jgi:hypothetical protein
MLKEGRFANLPITSRGGINGVPRWQRFIKSSRQHKGIPCLIRKFQSTTPGARAQRTAKQRAVTFEIGARRWAERVFPDDRFTFHHRTVERGMVKQVWVIYRGRRSDPEVQIGDAERRAFVDGLQGRSRP